MFNIFKPKADTISVPNPYDISYLEKKLNDWLTSPERKEMFVAENYYVGVQDILNKQRTTIGEGGTLQAVSNLPNNIILDNQYRKLVDQKTNYALGKPLTISTEDDVYSEALHRIFNKKMFKKIRALGKDAINGGIGYVYPYYDENGEFQIKIFPSYEIMPLWKDNDHIELECGVRVYTTEMYRNGTLKDIQRVEVYTMNGVDLYTLEGGKLISDANLPHKDYIMMGDNSFSWGRLPLIPFKYNPDEIPLIRGVKSLQDAINRIMSTFQDNMEEDPRTTILILQNYDGTDLGEFRRNLATYGVVKVHTVDGVKGGVDTLQIEVNAKNYQAILVQLKRSLVENGRGFDAKEERMDGDPNQMNIQSMYSDIDLDVNGMETEFQYGFEELKWFIDQYLMQSQIGDFTNTKVEFIFNRDILINENDIISNCTNSQGVISEKTIIAHHPWVTNLEQELKQIKEEEKQNELEQNKMFNSNISEE